MRIQRNFNQCPRKVENERWELGAQEVATKYYHTIVLQFMPGLQNNRPIRRGPLQNQP